MDEGLRLIAQEVQRLAATLPVELLHALAEVISQHSDDNKSYARAKALNTVASPAYRARIGELFRT